MDRNPVKSGMIKGIGYDPENKILEIEFANGSIGTYLDVPPEEHDNLLSAESAGSYLHKNIKPNYTYKG